MDDKKTAYLLRKQGFSYGEINRALVRKRSKSTLSYWFRGLPLSDYQKEELRERFAPKLAAAREKAIVAKARKKARRLAEIDEKNSELGALLGDNNARKALLGTLYLAEGSKNTRGSLTFGNSDPRIIRLYLFLLRASYPLDESKFRCTVQARADSPLPEFVRFWEKETAIPSEQFYKSRLDKRTIGQPSRKPEYKGVCRVDYLSADLFREVMSIGTILTSSLR